MESNIVWGKDGDVRGFVYGGGKFGGEYGAEGGREIELRGGNGKRKWRNEKGVDDVEDTIGKAEILSQEVQWGILGYTMLEKLTRLVRVDLEPSPLTATQTLPACCTPAIIWPPVTFSYVWLFSNVGRNLKVPLKESEG